MKFLTKSNLTIGLSIVALIATSLSFAGHHEESEDGEGKKSYREMKREHKQEYREMRKAYRADAMLKRVDANEDGQVDLNEYLAHAEQRFNKLDADGNGFVTADEAKESMSQMRKEHKEMRKKMREERKQNDK